MKNWAKETDNEGCWESVKEAWLEGQGLQDAYPPTWQGLFVMLEDVQFGGVVPALKEAVESAIPQGMFVFVIVQSIVANRPGMPWTVQGFDRF